MNFEAKNHPFWHNSNKFIKKNYVDSSNVALHYETEGHGKGVHLLQIHEFDNVRIPITIATWFFFITIAKIVFHRFSKISSILPDSAMLLVFGGIFGAIVHFIYPNEEFYLKPEWFFLYLLPPIALEAGFFLPNKDFFRNCGTIVTYAVFGTIWNIAFTGLTLYLFQDYFHGSPSALHILLFSTLISAVDPVAVISVFEEIHVNQLLYICVFGESLLNDAVTIVLYHSFNAMAAIGADNIVLVDYMTATSSFFVVSFGGIFIGAVWAMITGLTTRLGSQVNVVQPLICFIFPYMAYLIAETLSLSSMLAIVVCGLMMKQYISANISKKSLVTVKYFLKTVSSSCEALIFVYLGMSSISNNHDIDLLFIFITLISCLVYRFIGVIFLTYILNIKRQEKISLVDQFIMGYGGIRGAVCYGLVMSLDIGVVPCRNMFATTTIIVILFTVFLQGGTIKWLVKYLKVKQSEKRKKTLFEMLTENVDMHLMAGIESIAGLRGHYWFRIALMRFNQTYIQPLIMVKKVDKGLKLVEHNEAIQVKEAVRYLKEYGSFVGMPTVQSNPFLDRSNSVAKFQTNECPSTRFHPNKAITTRTRNISMRTFVEEKLEELNSPHQTYSRHFLDSDLMNRLHNLNLLDFNDNKINQDDDLIANDACYKTYPYSKSSQKDMVISNIRKTSQTSLMSQSNAHVTNHMVINVDPSDLQLPKKNEGNRTRPRFALSTSSIELDDSHFDNEENSKNDSIAPFHIGRFEIKSDDGLKIPIIYHRSNSMRSGTSDESILMPILEQDEKEQDDINYLSQV